MLKHLNIFQAQLRNAVRSCNRHGTVADWLTPEQSVVLNHLQRNLQCCDYCIDLVTVGGFGTCWKAHRGACAVLPFLPARLFQPSFFPTTTCN